jgi:hypothetical protein
LQQVNSIDRQRLRAEQVLLVTLTYPAKFPTPRRAKQQLKAALRRFLGENPDACGWWKLEPQKRGAPHFHLLIFMPEAVDVLRERRWWAANWYEVVGSGDQKHRAAGTACEKIRTWNGVASYAAKYIGKPVKDLGWDKPGRLWGKFNVEKLPVEVKCRQVSERTAIILRRALIRWYEHQPTGRHRITRKLHSGKRLIRREFRNHKELAALQQLNDNEFCIRPYHRRYPISRGGCGIFAPSDLTERLLPWAEKSAANYLRPVVRLGREGMQANE